MYIERERTKTSHIKLEQVGGLPLPNTRIYHKTIMRYCDIYAKIAKWTNRTKRVQK